MTDRELPRDVLKAHRTFLRKSQTQYAAETGDGTRNWPKDKIANLEQGKVKEFTEEDHEQWRTSWITDDGFAEFDQRMIAAMQYQKELLEEEKKAAPNQRQAKSEAKKPEGKRSTSCFDRLIIPVSIVVIVVAAVICVMAVLTYRLQIRQASDLLVSKLTVTPMPPRAAIATLVPPTSTPQTIPTAIAAVPSPENTTPPISTPTQPPTATPTQPPTATPIQPPTVTPTQPPPKSFRGVLFEDDFNDGLDPAWEVVRGDWRVANDKLTTVSRDNERSIMLVGDPTWSDYVVECEIDFRARTSDAIEVIVRAQDGQNGMKYWMKVFSARPDWRIVEDGNETVLVESELGLPLSPNIRIEVKDDNFVAYVDGEKWLSINDPTFTNGKVGLILHCSGSVNCSTMDNFKVTALE